MEQQCQTARSKIQYKLFRAKHTVVTQQRDTVEPMIVCKPPPRALKQSLRTLQRETVKSMFPLSSLSLKDLLCTLQCEIANSTFPFRCSSVRWPLWNVTCFLFKRIDGCYISPTNPPTRINVCQFSFCRQSRPLFPPHPVWVQPLFRLELRGVWWGMGSGGFGAYMMAARRC